PDQGRIPAGYRRERSVSPPTVHRRRPDELHHRQVHDPRGRPEPGQPRVLGRCGDPATVDLAAVLRREHAAQPGLHPGPGRAGGLLGGGVA
ncbi:hypothetical protein LTR94_035822, partial [Friedmanniomyces endolithicus]